MPTRTRQKITAALISSLKPRQQAFDAEVRGLFARCHKGGLVSFGLKTVFSRKQVVVTIGRYGHPWTIHQARVEAKRLLGLVASGSDPRKPPFAQKSTPTIADLSRRFIFEHARPNKKPSSAALDEMNIRNHIVPLLGDRPAVDVTRNDIERFKLTVETGRHATQPPRRGKGAGRGAVPRGGRGVASQCLAVLSKMFNLAEEWGWRPQQSNPVRHVKKFALPARERFLSEEEYTNVLRVLDEAERDGTTDSFAISAIRLLLLTGARKGEILNLRWEHVDLGGKRLRLPDSKTGAKLIMLSEPVVAILRRLPRIQGNPFVFPGKNSGAPLYSLRKPWHRIQERAGLHGVRIHDLRHSFASLAVANGISFSELGRLLGHRSVQTTFRYVHLDEKRVVEASEIVARKIWALNGTEPADATQNDANHGK